MMFEPLVERLSPDRRRERQQASLQRLVDRLLAVDCFQRRQLLDSGVSSKSDLTLQNLSKVVPVTNDDVRHHSRTGEALAVDRRHIVAFHSSSGTKGRHTIVAYTHSDLRLWARLCARSLACAGVTPSSIVHNSYGYGLFTGGLGYHYGAIELGAAVVPAGIGMVASQLRLIQELRPDVLACTPTYALRLGEAMKEAGISSDELSLKIGVFGAEPWTRAMREQIEHRLNLVAVDIYGLSEVIGPGVAAECIDDHDGLLHVNEDHILVEVIDPDTGTPLADGNTGELVFTTLTKTAMPLIRYRSGDVSSLVRTPCPCGRTLVRIKKVLGRIDDMLVVGGVNVYPSEIEQTILADRQCNGQYAIVVDRIPPGRLWVVCEYAGHGREASRAEMEYRFAVRLGIRPEIRFVAVGDLPRGPGTKAARLHIWHEGAEPPLPGLGDRSA